MEKNGFYGGIKIILGIDRTGSLLSENTVVCKFGAGVWIRTVCILLFFRI
jgi:hypothetical protein